MQGPNRLCQVDLASYSVINSGARRRPEWILHTITLNTTETTPSPTLPFRPSITEVQFSPWVCDGSYIWVLAPGLLINTKCNVHQDCASVQLSLDSYFPRCVSLSGPQSWRTSETGWQEGFDHGRSVFTTHTHFHTQTPKVGVDNINIL